MCRIGICFSGGAARGIAHLGVMKALNELKIPIEVISGTSSGAIAGAFLAAGFAPEKVLELVCDLSVRQFLRPALNKGILHSNSLLKIFEQHLESITFANLSTQLIISATDLNQGSTVYLSEGSVANALRASSALPIMFQPVAYQDMLLVDGGLLNNMPVECLTGACDQIIGVHVNPVNHQANIKTIRQVTERVFHLAINANVQQRVSYCNVFIEPPALKNYHIYAVNKAQEIFDIGYQHTKTLERELKSLVNS
ncbi:patatin-like phospholipase family protein [Nibribacter koreensis]|uniref:Patatin-like phospholipase family protein n=1 Tax=Nibribacter koreensis TaxID=1084519 RepID=A0ABP8F9T6_9BACT